MIPRAVKNGLNKRLRITNLNNYNVIPKNYTKDIKRTFFSPKDMVESTLKKMNPFESASSELKLNHYQEKILSFKPNQVYQVISNVEQYKEFLPYCIDSKIETQKMVNDIKLMEATLKIGFLSFEESYLSQVQCYENQLVIAENSNSKLFKSLTNRWELEPFNYGTKLKFSLEFELNSTMYHSVAKLYFNSIAEDMVQAFENRCQKLYN